MRQIKENVSFIDALIYLNSGKRKLPLISLYKLQFPHCTLAHASGALCDNEIAALSLPWQLALCCHEVLRQKKGVSNCFLKRKRKRDYNLICTNGPKEQRTIQRDLKPKVSSHTHTHTNAHIPQTWAHIHPVAAPAPAPCVACLTYARHKSCLLKALTIFQP